MMPHREVAMVARVLSMVGARALIQLHRRSCLRNGAMRRRSRRVKKMKKNRGISQLCWGFSNDR
jgi:hypothetical protein